MGDEPMTSPVTNTPCYYYKVEIARWKHSGNKSSWEHYKTDADGVKFFLEDGSGRILVDAQESELDLLKNRECEIGGGASPPPDGATEDELRSYSSQSVTRNGFTLQGFRA
jgi:hypothetical protein